MSQELEGTLTNEVNLVGTFGATGGGTTNYNDLINKPSINNVTLQGNKTGAQLGLVSSTDLATVATTGSYNDLTNKPTIPAAQVNSDWNSTSGVSEILNKPTIPTATSDLTNDSGFVTSSDLATVATTGSYTDLTNTPSIPAAQVNSDWNSISGVSAILNKPTIVANATQLPISGIDSTNTKDYIDTGLSGKANTSDIPTVDNSVSLSSTNPVQNKAITLANFFGNNGQYYSLNKTSLDAIANEVIGERYFSVDNLGDISGYGNRQFCFGWLNGTKKYGWIAVYSFGGFGIGRRNNADTFTVTKLV